MLFILGKQSYRQWIFFACGPKNLAIKPKALMRQIQVGYLPWTSKPFCCLPENRHLHCITKANWKSTILLYMIWIQVMGTVACGMNVKLGILLKQLWRMMTLTLYYMTIDPLIRIANQWWVVHWVIWQNRRVKL